MDNTKLQEKLDQLHNELEQTKTVDDESRAKLRHLMKDIQQVVDQPDDTKEAHGTSLRERLDNAVLQFEASHPHLTLAIGEVADELAQMGF